MTGGGVTGVSGPASVTTPGFDLARAAAARAVPSGMGDTSTSSWPPAPVNGAAATSIAVSARSGSGGSSDACRRAHASRLSANARALGYRVPGSSLSARATIRCRPAGTSGFASLTGTGGSVVRTVATAAALSADQGSRPVSISYSTTPSEKTSPAALASSPRACSGLR